MKSPFPGMDPYLERHWRDVHAELISLARTALNKELPQRLPSVRIPLRATDQDVLLNLQKLVEQVYENGQYDRLRYAPPCEPPLQASDEQWADELLRAAGR